MADNVLNHPKAYVPGSLELTREGETRFVMRGNYMIGGTHAADHCQLIYEALEIAAHSNDPFANVFAAMRDEWLSLTETWDE